MKKIFSLDIDNDNSQQSTLNTPQNDRIHARYEISNKARANKLASSTISRLLIKKLMQNPKKVEVKPQTSKNSQKPKFFPMYANLKIEEIDQEKNNIDKVFNEIQTFQYQHIDSYTSLNKNVNHEVNKFFKSVTSLPQAINENQNKFSKFIRYVDSQPKIRSPKKSARLFSSQPHLNLRSSTFIRKQDYMSLSHKKGRNIPMESYEPRKSLGQQDFLMRYNGFVQSDLDEKLGHKVHQLSNANIMSSLQDKYDDKLQCQMRNDGNQLLENIMDGRGILNYIGPMTLTEAQVNYLIEAFGKPKEQRDFQQILYILKENKFFKKLHSFTQAKVAKNCELLMFKKDNYIYKEGDEGNFIYIILDGSVVILKKDQVFKERQQNEREVEQLFDGQYFGEADSGASEKKRLDDILKKKTSEKINLQNLQELQDKVYLQKSLKNNLAMTVTKVEQLELKHQSDYKNQEIARQLQEEQQNLQKLKKDIVFFLSSNNQSNIDLIVQNAQTMLYCLNLTEPCSKKP